MPRVGVLGDAGVGKTSLVRALGAARSPLKTRRVAGDGVETFAWTPSGRRGGAAVRIGIYRDEQQRRKVVNDVAAPGDVLVLLFDLTRRASLDNVVAQWTSLLESNAGDWGRDVRVLLVGNKADQARGRDVLEKHCREVAEELGLYSYVEVCSLEGESHGVPLVQQLLAELTGLDVPMEQLRKTIADPIRSRRLPAAAARLFNRSSGKKADDKKARSVSPPPRRPYERAASWLYDPTEGIPEAVAGVQDSSMPSGDVKLRAISKAIYDIRGAGAEKCKAIAKYREREVSQWLSRSRYFGPTESSRHKRWQEDQKRKKQQQQQLAMQQQQERLRQRLDPTAAAAAALQPPLLERRRSLSHPGKFQSPHGLVGTSSGSCSDLSDSNEEATAPLAIDGKRSSEPKTPAAAQMEIQLEGELEAQRLRKAAKRAMRKKIRAASGDMYERHSSSWFNTPPPRLEALAPPMWSAHQRRPAAPTHFDAAGSRWSPSTSPSPPSRRTLSNASRPRSISPACSPSSSADGSSPSRHSSKSISPDRARLAMTPPTSLKRTPRRGSEASLGGITTPDTIRVAVSLTSSSPSSASDNDLKKEGSPTKDQRAGKAREEKSMSNAISAPEPDVGPTPVVRSPVETVSPHTEAKQAAPIPCGSSTTSEELDCGDIDEMLEYFDNVTLQL